MELPALGEVSPMWERGIPLPSPAPIRVWDIPCSWKPSRFAKGDYLPDELIEAVDESPNNQLVPRGQGTTAPGVAAAARTRPRRPLGHIRGS